MIRLMRSQDDHRHHHYHHLHVDIDIIPHLLHLPLPKALHLPLHLLDHLKSVQVDHIGVLTLLLVLVLVLLLLQIRIKHHEPIPSKNENSQISLPSIHLHTPLPTFKHDNEDISYEAKHRRMGDQDMFIRNHIHTQVKTKILGEDDLSEVVLLARPSTPPPLDLLVLLDHTVLTVLTAPLGVI